MTARLKLENYIGETPEQLNARTQLRLQEMKNDAEQERMQFEAPYKRTGGVTGANRRALYGEDAPVQTGAGATGKAAPALGREAGALARAAIQGASLGAGSSYAGGAGAPSPVAVMRGLTQTYQAPIEGAWGTETATEKQARQLYNQQALRQAEQQRALTGAKIDFPQYGRYISEEEEKAIVTGEKALKMAQTAKNYADARQFNATQDTLMRDRMGQHVLKNLGNEHFDMVLKDGKQVPQFKAYVQDAITQAIADMQPGENEGVTMKRLGEYLKQSSVVQTLKDTDPKKVDTLLREFEQTEAGQKLAGSIAAFRGRNGVWDRTDSPLAEALLNYNKTRTVGKEQEKRPLTLSEMPQTIGFADADIPDYRMEAPSWLQRSSWALEHPLDFLENFMLEHPNPDQAAARVMGSLWRGINRNEQYNIP